MRFFWQQTWTLTKKNLRIIWFRHWFSSVIRAFVLPIVFIFIIGYMKNFFVPPSNFGIGEPVHVRGFIDALTSSTGGRDTVAFVDNGYKGGKIEELIKYMSVSIRAAGKTVKILANEDELLTTCRSSLRGVTGCYGAAVLHSSPTEGDTGIWNYTIRADGSLNGKIFVDKHNNDPELYLLPFQHALDMAMINEVGNGTKEGEIANTVNEYAFTDRTNQERADDIRRIFMNAINNFLGVVFYLGVVGIIYHQIGFMATERELGMSQLIEAMTPNKYRWQTQMARLLSNQLAFIISYAPSWIIIGAILKSVVFTQSSFGVLIGFNIIAGLSFSSMSTLWGSFFRKAQLSGITGIIVSLLLAIISQVAGPHGTGAVAILSVLFAPMNYTFYIINTAHWEKVKLPTNLSKVAPGNEWNLLGGAFWVFAVIQIFLYFIIAAFVERWRHGTASKARKVHYESSEATPAIKLTSFSKHYVLSSKFWKREKGKFWRREKPKTVVAVNALTLDVIRGQILVLLGANGSGKSTTLDAIAGLGKITAGGIEIDGTGGLGLCPQKNVLWDELTVFEHVNIFNGLKAPTRDSKGDTEKLIEACDLKHKMHAKSKTLSGGQKRKLQLAMMFTGGSRVCCVDEVSSGLDPLSRRKIWDILLEQRGRRTLLFTTHFLDEADVLADHIAMLSKGNLKAEGSAAELKHKYGGGYRVQINNLLPDLQEQVMASQKEVEPKILSVASSSTVQLQQTLHDESTYEKQFKDSATAAKYLTGAEQLAGTDHSCSVIGPSIENVFLHLAEEAQQESEPAAEPLVTTTSVHTKMSDDTPSSHSVSKLEQPIDEVNLQKGLGTNWRRQTWILFRKRFTVWKQNKFPYICSLVIPIFAAGIVLLFFKNFSPLTCSPKDQVTEPTTYTLNTTLNLKVPVGPPDRVDKDILFLISGNSSIFHMVDTLEEFNNFIKTNYSSTIPGGFFLGDTPTIAYIGNYFSEYALFTQNAMDIIQAGEYIATDYQPFAVPFAPSAGKTLQAIFYVGLALCAYPGFFTLYPTVERLRKVRALHYSNGIQAAPLWLAYTAFDFLWVLAVSLCVIIIWVAANNIWYAPGTLFVVLFLFGLTSTLFSYVVSLFVSSQLAAFAWAVGIQAIFFLLYFVSYLSILTYSPTYNIDRNILIAHFTISLVTPAGNLLRALLLTLNEFSILCNGGDKRASNPGELKVYGGPILYLICQAVILFIFLVWWDSGYKPAIRQHMSTNLQRMRIGKKSSQEEKDVERNDSPSEPDNLAEVAQIPSTSTGLRVLHVNKSFAGVQAVEDITFDIPPSTVFALLGPNGAGKSTTISLIRGDLHPDHHGGDVLVDGISITRHRANARGHLGVCPQFDAMDLMTVVQHLRFYAAVRAVQNITDQVDAVIAKVGLQLYRNRLAQKLSGGNKRKLSLAIAIIGNPDVLLLDEPSSGMDAASKRVMWRTLKDVSKGRAMLITTHSMEEADHLANNVGIMASRMLALGSSSSLRKRFGAKWHVHLVLKGAPHVSDADAQAVRIWIEENVEDVSVEDRMWHGQLRFSVPSEGRSIAKLFSMLEDNRETRGLEYYSISETTLDQVFLEVVHQHDIEEEGSGAGHNKKGWKSWKGWFRKVVDDA